MNIDIDLQLLSAEDLRYIEPFLEDGRQPALEEIWALMDAAWDECGCDQKVMDERVTRFYQHPVWLLNGLFIEQHEGSLANRRVFTEWVVGIAPRRVADFGGGFGTLARMIGEACPEAAIEIAEPSPHPAAVALASKSRNVRFVPELSGDYDLIIATDVFEHVPDPLALVEETAGHLDRDGLYMMANAFGLEMKCHLPSNYHFRWSWDAAMAAMNLAPGPKVAYGRVFTKTGPVSVSPARGIERRSRVGFGLFRHAPPRLQRRAIRPLLGGAR